VLGPVLAPELELGLVLEPAQVLVLEPALEQELGQVQA